MERRKSYDCVNIQAVRKFMKLTQEKFAKKFKISRDILAKYETGVTGVPFETVEKIVYSFKVDANDFYDKIFDQLTGKFLLPENNKNAELDLLKDQVGQLAERLKLVEEETKKNSELLQNQILKQSTDKSSPSNVN